MLGMGPILWRQANQVMHLNPRASGAEPVSRDEASIARDHFCFVPKYRYESPAAWLYYRMIDHIDGRLLGEMAVELEGVSDWNAVVMKLANRHGGLQFTRPAKP